MNNPSPTQRTGRGIAFWMPIGAGIGAGIGIATHNLALGIGIGLALGAAVGTASTQRGIRDAKAPDDDATRPG